MQIIPIPNIPIIKKNDNIANLVFVACNNKIPVKENDIFVLAQTIISKSEGNIQRISEISVTKKAEEIAKRTQKDPRVIQIILNESKEIIKVSHNTIITETHHGFICANAGVDISNVDDGFVTLLPKDPDLSAKKIRKELESQFKQNLAVIITDSVGRPFRKGCLGYAIGSSGISPLIDLRGKKDLYGKTLQTTQVALIDMIASSANLVMGEASEGVPIVIVRGLKYPKKEFYISELFYRKEDDLFR